MIIEIPLDVVLLGLPAGMIVGYALVRRWPSSLLLAIVLVAIASAAGLIACVGSASAAAATLLVFVGLMSGASTAIWDHVPDDAWRMTLRSVAVPMIALGAGAFLTGVLLGLGAGLLMASIAGVVLTALLVLPEAIDWLRRAAHRNPTRLPRWLERVMRAPRPFDRSLERSIGVVLSLMLPFAAVSLSPWSAHTTFALQFGLAGALVIGVWAGTSEIRATVPAVLALLGAIVLGLAHTTALAAVGALLLGLGAAPVARRAWHVAHGRPEHFHRVLVAMVLIGGVVGA